MCCIVFVSVCVYVYMQSQNVYDDTNSVFSCSAHVVGCVCVFTKLDFYMCDASVLCFSCVSRLV